MHEQHLAWLVASVVAILVSVIISALGHWWRRRQYAKALVSWDEHAHRKVSGNVTHLRHRRDKIN